MTNGNRFVSRMMLFYRATGSDGGGPMPLGFLDDDSPDDTPGIPVWMAMAEVDKVRDTHTSDEPGLWLWVDGSWRRPTEAESLLIAAGRWSEVARP
jgi:hypothetical protein